MRAKRNEITIQVSNTDLMLVKRMLCKSTAPSELVFRLFSRIHYAGRELKKTVKED